MIVGDEQNGALTSQDAQDWNAAVAVWTGVRQKYDLQPSAGVDQVIQDIENDWFEVDPDHEYSVTRFNRLVNGVALLKTAVEAEMAAYKYGDANTESETLDWDDIIPKLTEISRWGFVQVEARDGLGGGHGDGATWRATSPSWGEWHSGTVPTSTHGRKGGALNGARGDVASVVDLHNWEIDQVIAGLKWPARALGW